MKRTHLLSQRGPITRLVASTLFPLLPTLLFSGCAVLDLVHSSRSPDEELATTDPVAHAAMKIRQGSDRSPAGLSQISQTAEAENSPDQYQRLVLGMSMSRVRSLWGAPQDVESAGDSSQGNERWTYYSGLSSRWSASQFRTVYFEQGKVTGWETGQN